MAEFMGNAWQKAATPHNIISGFKTPGIRPIDRNAFEREGYLPSTVTDRPLVCDETVDSTSELTSRPTEQSVTPVIEMPAPVDHSSNVTTTPRRSAGQPGVTKFIAPEEFRGYPKVIIVLGSKTT